MVERVAGRYAKQMLADLQDYSDAEIIHGLGIYLGRQLNMKGYGWHYAAGVVKKEAKVLRLESSQLSPLPPLRG